MVELTADGVVCSAADVPEGWLLVDPEVFEAGIIGESGRTEDEGFDVEPWGTDVGDVRDVRDVDNGELDPEGEAVATGAEPLEVDDAVEAVLFPKPKGSVRK